MFKGKSTKNTTSNPHQNNAFIQPKLKVGKVDDPYEQQADKAADQIIKKGNNQKETFFSGSPSVQAKQGTSFFQKPVVSKISPGVQLKEELPSEDESTLQKSEKSKTEVEALSNTSLQTKNENSKAVTSETITHTPSKVETQLQKKEDEEIQKREDEEAEQSIQKLADYDTGDTSNLEKDLSSSKGGGDVLPTDTRSEMESGFGADFSGVRVHNDSNAVQMNQGLGSQAFTNGNDIYFNEGKYDTGSDSGKHLLAHELTHTIQQGASSNSNSVQRKPQDHQKGSDGANVKSRMYSKAKSDSEEDVDFSKSKASMSAEEKEKANTVDYSKKNQQKSGISSSGQAKPDVNRPKEELPKVKEAKEEGKENLEETPKQEAEKDAPKEKGKKKLSADEQKDQQAKIAQQKAKAIKMPSKPEVLVSPEIKKPVDSAGKEIASDANNDKNVRALHEIAKLFMENAFSLEEEAFNDKKESFKMKAQLEASYAKVERTKTGSKTLKDHTDSREGINNKEEEALTKVEADTAMVKAEAPKLKSKSEEGKEESGPMASDANASKSEMDAKKPDDPDAAADAAKQAKDTDKVANDSASMDDAFGQTATRAEQYAADAELGAEKNIQSRATIDENKTIVESTRGEITRIDEENSAAEGQLDTLNTYPEKAQKETAQRAKSAKELYTTAKGMNEELTSIQRDYYSEMATLPSKEVAQKKKDEEDAKKQEAPAPTPLSPEEEMLVGLSYMGEDQIEASLAGMDEKELASLDQALGGMQTEKDSPNNQLVGPADKHTGQVKVDLMKAFQSDSDPKTKPDPRQEDITKIENKRTERIRGVKETADVNFVFISQEQKQMLAQKLAMQNAVSGLFDIKILDMGKAMLMGMLNPVESLKGVVDGASKMLTGAANLFNAEAWKKDPLGNLLQSAADIATGLTMIFMSITGLATAITIIMTAITIATLGFAAPITGPIISFMAGVITTVGGWTIVTGLIALALNSLTYIKNVHDAGVAQNTDQLLAESDAIKQNMTDGFTSAMAVVGAKGDVAGAKAMQKSIMKAGGGEAFAAAKGLDFKDGLGKAGKATKNFVEGGVVSGTKKMAANGVTKVKDGIKNAIGKAKQGIQDAPTNVKNKFKNGVDNLKDKFRSKKAKGGVVETPHGKLKTPTKGDSLGNFEGQKVKAEMEFPDGHRAKALENGQCAVCSYCQKIRSRFRKEVQANPKLADELKNVELKLKKDPTNVELIAKQKDLHDEFYKRRIDRLETELQVKTGKKGRQDLQDEINTLKAEKVHVRNDRIDVNLDMYDSLVKKGQFSRKGKTAPEKQAIRDQLDDAFDKGKSMSPNSGLMVKGKVPKPKGEAFDVTKHVDSSKHGDFFHEFDGKGVHKGVDRDSWKAFMRGKYDGMSPADFKAGLKKEFGLSTKQAAIFDTPLFKAKLASKTFDKFNIVRALKNTSDTAKMINHLDNIAKLPASTKGIKQLVGDLAAGGNKLDGAVFMLDFISSKKGMWGKVKGFEISPKGTTRKYDLTISSGKKIKTLEFKSTKINSFGSREWGEMLLDVDDIISKKMRWVFDGKKMPAADRTKLLKKINDLADRDIVDPTKLTNFKAIISKQIEYYP